MHINLIWWVNDIQNIREFLQLNDKMKVHPKTILIHSIIEILCKGVYPNHIFLIWYFIFISFVETILLHLDHNKIFLVQDGENWFGQTILLLVDGSQTQNNVTENRSALSTFHHILQILVALPKYHSIYHSKNSIALKIALALPKLNIIFEKRSLH